MSMGMLPHHFTYDHTHLFEFSKVKQEFLEQLYFWPFELVYRGGGVLFPFWFFFLIFFLNESDPFFLPFELVYWGGGGPSPIWFLYLNSLMNASEPLILAHT